MHGGTTGNLAHLNRNGKSVGIISDILGIETSSPLNFPVIIVSITLLISFLTAGLVPLHSFDWFKLRNMIITPSLLVERTATLMND